MSTNDNILLSIRSCGLSTTTSPAQSSTWNQGVGADDSSESGSWLKKPNLQPLTSFRSRGCTSGSGMEKSFLIHMVAIAHQVSPLADCGNYSSRYLGSMGGCGRSLGGCASGKRVMGNSRAHPSLTSSDPRCSYRNVKGQNRTIPVISPGLSKYSSIKGGALLPLHTEDSTWWCQHSSATPGAPYADTQCSQSARTKWSPRRTVPGLVTSA